MALSQEEKLEKAYASLQELQDLIESFRQASEDFKESLEINRNIIK